MLSYRLFFSSIFIVLLLSYHEINASVSTSSGGENSNYPTESPYGTTYPYSGSDWTTNDGGYYYTTRDPHTSGSGYNDGSGYDEGSGYDKGRNEGGLESTFKTVVDTIALLSKVDLKGLQDFHPSQCQGKEDDNKDGQKDGHRDRYTFDGIGEFGLSANGSYNIESGSGSYLVSGIGNFSLSGYGGGDYTLKIMGRYQFYSEDSWGYDVDEEGIEEKILTGNGWYNIFGNGTYLFEGSTPDGYRGSGRGFFHVNGTSDTYYNISGVGSNISAWHTCDANPMSGGNYFIDGKNKNYTIENNHGYHSFLANGSGHFNVSGYGGYNLMGTGPYNFTSIETPNYTEIAYPYFHYEGDGIYSLNGTGKFNFSTNYKSYLEVGGFFYGLKGSGCYKIDSRENHSHWEKEVYSHQDKKEHKEDVDYYYQYYGYDNLAGYNITSNKGKFEIHGESIYFKVSGNGILEMMKSEWLNSQVNNYILRVLGYFKSPTLGYNETELFEFEQFFEGDGDIKFEINGSYHLEANGDILLRGDGSYSIYGNYDSMGEILRLEGSGASPGSRVWYKNDDQSYYNNDDDQEDGQNYDNYDRDDNDSYDNFDRDDNDNYDNYDHDDNDKYNNYDRDDNDNYDNFDRDGSGNYDNYNHDDDDNDNYDRDENDNYDKDDKERQTNPICLLGEDEQWAAYALMNTGEDTVENLVEYFTGLVSKSIGDKCKSDTKPWYCAFHMGMFEKNGERPEDGGSEQQCTLMDILGIVSNPETYMEMLDNEMMECVSGESDQLDSDNYYCNELFNQQSIAKAFGALLETLDEEGLPAVLFDDDIVCPSEKYKNYCDYKQHVNNINEDMTNVRDWWTDDDVTDLLDFLKGIPKDEECPAKFEKICEMDYYEALKSVMKLADGVFSFLDNSKEGEYDSDSEDNWEVAGIRERTMLQEATPLTSGIEEAPIEDTGDLTNSNETSRLNTILNEIQNILELASQGQVLIELMTSPDMFSHMANYESPEDFCNNYENSSDFSLCKLDAGSQQEVFDIIGSVWNSNNMKMITSLMELMTDTDSMKYIMDNEMDSEDCDTNYPSLPATIQDICDAVNPNTMNTVINTVNFIGNSASSMAPLLCLGMGDFSFLGPLLKEVLNETLSGVLKDALKAEDVDKLLENIDLPDFFEGFKDELKSDDDKADKNESDDNGDSSDVIAIILLILLVLVVIVLLIVLYVQFRIMRQMMRNSNLRHTVLPPPPPVQTTKVTPTRNSEVPNIEKTIEIAPGQKLKMPHGLKQPTNLPPPPPRYNIPIQRTESPTDSGRSSENMYTDLHSAMPEVDSDYGGR